MAAALVNGSVISLPRASSTFVHLRVSRAGFIYKYVGPAYLAPGRKCDQVVTYRASVLYSLVTTNRFFERIPVLTPA